MFPVGETLNREKCWWQRVVFNARFLKQVKRGGERGERASVGEKWHLLFFLSKQRRRGKFLHLAAVTKTTNSADMDSHSAPHNWRKVFAFVLFYWKNQDVFHRTNMLFICWFCLGWFLLHYVKQKTWIIIRLKMLCLSLHFILRGARLAGGRPVVHCIRPI